jgi:hypothetical protein
MEFLPAGAVYTDTAAVPMFLASAFLNEFAIFFYPSATAIAIEKLFASSTAEILVSLIAATTVDLSVVVRLFRGPILVFSSLMPPTAVVASVSNIAVSPRSVAIVLVLTLH